MRRLGGRLVSLGKLIYAGLAFFRKRHKQRRFHYPAQFVQDVEIVGENVELYISHIPALKEIHDVVVAMMAQFGAGYYAPAFFIETTSLLHGFYGNIQAQGVGNGSLAFWVVGIFGHSFYCVAEKLGFLSAGVGDQGFFR